MGSVMSLTSLKFQSGFTQKGGSPVVYQGEPKRKRLVDGLAECDRIIQPFVRFDQGQLATGFDVMAVDKPQVVIGSHSASSDALALVQAWRYARLLGTLDRIEMHKLEVATTLVAELRDGLESQQILTLEEERGKCAVDLGIAIATADAVLRSAPPQADVEAFYGFLGERRIRFDHDAVLRPIRNGLLQWSPALGMAGIEDPAITKARAAQDDVCFETVEAALRMMMHHLEIASDRVPAMKKILGQAVRKGVNDVALQVGIACHLQSIHGGFMRSFGPITILGMSPTPALGVNTIAAVLAVVFSQKTADDHCRELKALLDRWESMKEGPVPNVK